MVGVTPRWEYRMRVAYLVNQYPHVSHSFIRREIAGLEACGVAVERFAIRPPGQVVVDPADRAETARTRSLLGGGKRRVLAAAMSQAIRHPIRFARAFAAAWQMGAAAGRRGKHLAYLAEACLLLRWLRDSKADHLHAHFGTNPAVVAAVTRILGGPPYSFTVHGPEEFDHPEELSLGRKIHGAAFVVAVSSFGRSQLYRWAKPDDWAKVHVVRCGVDAEFLRGGPNPVPDVSRVVCVGRLAEQKGQLLLVDAVARLAEQGTDCELVLAGDGPMRGRIEAAVRDAGLTGRVRITGWLSNDAVREEMLAARAVVLPSFAEGLPVVLMEALAFGRPVVTTFVAGIPELVKDAENGWLVPAGDVAALCDALAEALQTPTERLDELGAAGAEAVRRFHDAAKESRRLATLFGYTRVHPADRSPAEVVPLAVTGGVP